ncbi:hypothetical protein N9H63_01110 [bacterium]|jgi:hypothetical protein|nr:hypothetical protein [bacterium]
MKYKLEMYGWEVEATGHSLTDEQVKSIQDLMETNGADELWEVRHDIEMEGIVDDLYNPDLYHVSRGLDNSGLWFSLKDDKDNEVLSFEPSDMEDIYEMLGDSADDIPYEGYLAIPGEGDKSEVDNILAIFDENKGGICDFEMFESDEVPTAKDFCVQHGDIGTPDGDWDFISKVFYKGKELEVYDHLDNRGKAATVEIYRKDGSTIS